MIAPWIFYALVATNHGDVTVIDTYRDAGECEQDAVYARDYFQDNGISDVVIKCTVTRYQDLDLAQKHIVSIYQSESKSR
jgi:hypothetical protein